MDAFTTTGGVRCPKEVLPNNLSVLLLELLVRTEPIFSEGLMHRSLVFPLLVIAVAGCSGSPGSAPNGIGTDMSESRLFVRSDATCPVYSGGSGILSDGDFSEAQFPGGYETFDSGQSFAPNWTVTGPRSIDFIGSYWTTPGGLCSVDLDGSPGPGGIEHTAFSTTSGVTYKLGFEFSGNGACLPKIKKMTIFAAGQKETLTWNIDDGDAQSGDFKRNTWEFVADSKMTILQFKSDDPNPGSCGPVVAAITVKQE